MLRLRIYKKLFGSIFVAIYLLSGCSSGDSNDNKPKTEVIRIKGNPLNFIEGTEKNTAGGLNASLFNEPNTEWEISYFLIKSENIE